MVRYTGYIIDAHYPKIIEMLNNKEFLFDSDFLKEKLVDYKFNISTSEVREWTVTAKKDHHSYMACFAQMDGNCNALMVNSMYPRSMPTNSKEYIRITTGLMKTIASLSGDNVMITSHYSSLNEDFKDAGWNIIGEAPSNRGYHSNISYYMLEIPKKEMVTTRFEFMNNKK